MVTAMNKNEIYRAEITSLTNEGMGVCRINGRVFFVPFSAVGDVLDIKILKAKKSYGYGKIERIITPSGDRKESDCPAFGRCGGCSFRHISYEAELAAKEGFIKDAFTRIGKLSPQFLPIVKNENPHRYRNKAQYPLGKDRDGQAVCGFYAPNSHRVVPCRDCMLQPEIFSEIVAFIMSFIRENKLSIYSEAEHRGVLRHICIRRGYYSGEICVAIVAKRRIPEMRRLAKAVTERFPAVKGVVLNINREDTNVIFGREEIVLAGVKEITDTMCKNTVKISPGSFYQVNTPMAEKLYGIAKEFARPEGKFIADIYCGIGTIGLSMAKEARKIVGVEIVESAVENAKENARLNGFDNAEFYCADADSGAEILRSLKAKPDVIVLDPARKGCDGKALKELAELGADRIVMISCNPATAARDCGALCELGYRCETVRGVDLFSGTYHVECVVLLDKANN